jgi:hypothetical protein
MHSIQVSSLDIWIRTKMIFELSKRIFGLGTDEPWVRLISAEDTI